jgi:Ca2+-binding RTX toxin-like protein
MHTRAFRRASRLGMVATVGLVANLVVASPAHATPPSASASIVDRTLTITGSNAADDIAISVGAANPNVLLVDFGNDGTVDQQVDRSAFDSLNVQLGNGNDHFTATGVTVPRSSTIDGGNGDDSIVGTGSDDLVFGGNGNDTINSAGGNDTVDAGAGNDFVIGGVGHDTATLDDGDDVFRWDPGEGSDDVDGGIGNDVLLFNGANNNETMSLSAVDTRAVFLRSPGSVVMNLDAVEQLDLHALGGADNITINDVTGTSLRQANLDLSGSATGVGSDTQPDVVTVNGTNSDDHVSVSGNAAQVDVAGLAAGVQIRGSSAAELDHLQVNTLDGNDTVAVDSSALALIGITTDLGAGQV